MAIVRDLKLWVLLAEQGVEEVLLGIRPPTGRGRSGVVVCTHQATHTKEPTTTPPHTKEPIRGDTILTLESQAMVSETDRLFLFGLVAALLPVIVFVFSLVSVLLGAPFILIGTPYVFMSPVGLLFWGVVMVLVWAWASQKEHSHATGVGLIMGGAITALFFLAFIMLTILSVLP